tara:strand:+ start:256 stop:483 length:228 start_codon:yes stop_codon:yes gene_type:complete
MVDYLRYTASVNKKGEWRAYEKKTNKSQENIVADTKDRLVTMLKKEKQFTRHYRRRGEWVLCNNDSNVDDSKTKA